MLEDCSTISHFPTLLAFLHLPMKPPRNLLWGILSRFIVNSFKTIQFALDKFYDEGHLDFLYILLLLSHSHRA